MAAFMEVFDTSVANVALPYMAGSLGAHHSANSGRLVVLAIAASIMFLLSFIVRKNDPKASGGVAVG